eukprot:gene21810-27753_t
MPPRAALLLLLSPAAAHQRLQLGQQQEQHGQDGGWRVLHPSGTAPQRSIKEEKEKKEQKEKMALRTRRTVATTDSGAFVGAPFLIVTSKGNLQVYYDNEQAARDAGCSGSHGAWGAPTDVVEQGRRCAGLLRDGMASVVQLDTPSRLMVVREGVAPAPPHQNIVTAAESSDYVWAAFCTDDDFPPPADPSGTPVGRRRCHAKYVRTTATFENWSAVPETIYSGADHMYEIGLFERLPNDVIATVELFDGHGVAVLAHSGAHQLGPPLGLVVRGVRCREDCQDDGNCVAPCPYCTHSRSTALS